MRIGTFVILALLAGVAAFGAEATRIYITDSNSWEMSGGVGVPPGVRAGSGGSSLSGGARPQTAEIMKTFSKRCPAVTVTLDRTKADFIVLLDHEGGKEMVLRDNKIAVFNRDQDMIYSGSTRSLGNAVKDACAAIGKAPHK